MSIVLGNILGNAFSYTRSGGITVIVDNKKIVVIDTGVGMSDEERQKVFEPFYRTRVDGGQHQGLGLTIVRQSCQNYGWEIRLDSVQGQGTRVTIEFKT